VIPVNELRFFPAPIANEDDPKIAADEWRTRVLTLQNVEAANLVPILRPLLPQSAHLAAFPPSNQLLIVDRYANLKRITEIVRTMDRPPRK
jgi:general secretion pathway protein D